MSKAGYLTVYVVGLIAALYAAGSFHFMGWWSVPFSMWLWVTAIAGAWQIMTREKVSR